MPDAGRRLLFTFERRQISGRFFFRGENGVHHRAEERRGADVERVAHRVGDRARCTGRHAEPVGEHPGRGRGQHRPQSDEQTLHREPAGTRTRGQQIRDERAERFHRDVDRGIENPEQPRRHPQGTRVGHRNQRQRTQDGANQKEWSPAPEARRPGAVTQVSDDGLHDQSGQRRRQPQHRNLVGTGAKVFVDGAHVGHLQSPAELNAEEAEAHVPDGTEARR
jgi:hypothetical protein